MEEGNPSSKGVDLALSFQNNGGCMDIWEQITKIQSNAATLRNENGMRNFAPQNQTQSQQQQQQQQQHQKQRSHHVRGMPLINGVDTAVGGGGGGGTKQQGNIWMGSSSSPSPDGPPSPHHQHHLHNHPQHQQHSSDTANTQLLQQQQHHNHHHHHQQQQQQQHHHPEPHPHHHHPLHINHHPQHQQQQQQQQQHPHDNNNNNNAHDDFEDTMGGIVAAYHENTMELRFPNPPTVDNLEEIADTMAGMQTMQQRESLAFYIAQNDCSCLKSLLALFPSAEEREDYKSLSTLAACIKTILLLNDASIIDLIVSDERMFEDICSTLEYDPDLRDKANHRWFLRERAKFRTVVPMKDPDLISCIHRSFRVNYLRDTLLRPTMDESSLSTLSSMQIFIHTDVVKGVTMSPASPASNQRQQQQQQQQRNNNDYFLQDSYFSQIMKVLKHEVDSICEKQWDHHQQRQQQQHHRHHHHHHRHHDEHMIHHGRTNNIQNISYDSSMQDENKSETNNSTIWRQHVAPQDDSLQSCMIRRRGCLSFLRELFNMVRLSLQQTDRDDFLAAAVSMSIHVPHVGTDDHDMNDDDATNRQRSDDGKGDDGDNDHAATNGGGGSVTDVRLLSLLATVLSDPSTDVTEKGAVLEIIGGITNHDPSLIQRHCIEYFMASSEDLGSSSSPSSSSKIPRPRPNWKRQVIFQCQPGDLLAALLYMLSVETDAGVLLQVTEILRAVLDTDMVGDQGPLGGGFADEAEGIPPHQAPVDHHNTVHPHAGPANSEQKKFLAMFYDHYIEWLTAPFQHSILHLARRVPESVRSSESYAALMQSINENFEKGDVQNEPQLCSVRPCAIRSSFAVDLLSFCVRLHVYRMKTYLLRSKVVSNVLKLLKPSADDKNTSGDRCLKLAALRFLRAILAVNEELYHRHIIHHNLFEPVFQAFRANPVGDNLVSSSIVEMCDFIHNENIKSLVEHIVVEHLSSNDEESLLPSLEDVSSPYVTTLTVLRKTYESNLAGGSAAPGPSNGQHQKAAEGILDEKAREDQRKFRELDNEESYFDADDDDEGPSPNHQGRGNLTRSRSFLSGFRQAQIPMADSRDQMDTSPLGLASSTSPRG